MRAETLRLGTLVRRQTFWRRFLVFAVLFLAWSGPGAEALAFAIFGAGLSALVSMALSPRSSSLRLGALLRFVPYFLSISLRGGVDVAGRAFSPSMPLTPSFVNYSLRPASGESAVVFFSCVISLVPGTLCARVQENTLLLHTIGDREKVLAELERLEGKVAQIFHGPDFKEEEK